MAYIREYGQEWREQLAETNYPFCDSSSLRASAELVLDRAAIYDASFYIVNWNRRLFLTTIEITADPRTEVIISVGSASVKQAAKAIIDPFNVPEVISFKDALGRPAGIMVVNPVSMALLQTWPRGIHDLKDNAEFVPSVILPMPDFTLSSIRCSESAPGCSEPDLVSGDIWLIGEDGVVVRMDNGAIRVDVVGDVLFKRREQGGDFITPNFIKTINGISPDDYGDFKIIVGTYIANDTILRVYPDPSLPGIRIELVGQSLQSTN